ncbi:uncharacterized protein LOC114844396 isoform X4 [Betta splendens]|nr:uncharacterized protein LOC114844396 isoform X4 [Betta splendens]
MRQRMRQVRRAKRRADACIGLRESRDRYSYRIGHVTCISGAPNCVYKEAHTSTGFIYQKQFLNIYQRLTNSSGIMEPPPAKRKVSAVWDHFDLLSENKTIKQMVAKKYEEEKERVKMEVQQAVATTFGKTSTLKWAGRLQVPQLMPSRRFSGTWQRAILLGHRIH